MFTGDPTGEIYTAEQAMATIMAQAWGEIFSLTAISTATGATSTAAGVFEMKRLVRTVTKKINEATVSFISIFMAFT